MSASPVIIVTGASRGIGLATLHHLLSLPHPPKILACSRGAIPLQSEHITPFSVDFSTKSHPSPVTYCLSHSDLGRIDGILLNHGTLDPVQSVEEANVEEWETCFRTNFFSCVKVVQEAVIELRKRKGRVVFVSSGAAVSGYLGWGAYGSTKAAMNHFNLTLAAQEPEIVSIAIRPGVVDTAMQIAIREQHGDTMKHQHAKFMELKDTAKLVKPEDVAVILGNLMLNAEKELSGKFLSWDDDTLKAYRTS